MTTPPSIREVAREAGVSTATVSHAIHGTRPVAAATRARVEEVAARLGYQPNRLARGLRTKRTQTVGMLVMDFRNPAIATYVEGAESVLDAAGYNLVVASVHGGADAAAGRLERLQEFRADGLIVNAQSPELLRRLEGVAASRPVVLANAFSDDLPADGQLPPWLAAVIVDEENACAKATSHLLRLGHRDVAFVQHTSTFWNAAQRLRGYRQALAAADVPFEPALVIEHQPGSVQAGDLVHQLLSMDRPPTAAIVAPDSTSRRFFSALLDAAVSMPSQLALVAYAVGEWMDVARPRLTAIEPPIYEVGTAAAQALLRMLDQEDAQSDDGKPEAAKTKMITKIRAPLVVRESCGARTRDSQ